MEIRAIGRCLVTLALVGVILTTGCMSSLSSGGDQVHADAYPRFPFKIMAPIHYQGITVSESDTAITTLIFNLTVVPEPIFSTVPEQDMETNITEMYIRYSDGRDLYTLELGEFSISRQEGGDDNNMPKVGEVVELILPLQQPVPANTSVSADFWMPYYGTLTLVFNTPEEVEPSGQITEFTTEYLV